jgi:hypothetical protein
MGLSAEATRPCCARQDHPPPALPYQGCIKFFDTGDYFFD